MLKLNSVKLVRTVKAGYSPMGLSLLRWEVFLFLLMGVIRLASLNINGARESRKRVRLFETMTQKNLDILFLQETHSDSSNASDWASEFDGLSILSHSTSMSGGVAILFSKSFIPTSFNVEEIIKGRLLKVNAFYENKFCFVLICVYVPNTAIERMLFLNTLCNTLKL